MLTLELSSLLKNSNGAYTLLCKDLRMLIGRYWKIMRGQLYTLSWPIQIII